MRIVSLLPSATDIVCALGLRDQLVGRTHECDWPPGVEDVPAVTADSLATDAMTSREINDAIGGAAHAGSSIYGLDVGALQRVKPDLIITQELCDVCAVSYREVQHAARLMDAGPTVVSLEPSSLDDILDNIRLVGELTGAEERANDVIVQARARLAALREAARSKPRPRVACIEWLEPIFAGGHWVPDQVDAAGGEDVLGPRRIPSREIPWQAVIDSQPEVVVLMPCGMAIKRTLSELDSVTERKGWNELPAVRDGRVFVVDGSSYFNRPGPRVVRGAEILQNAFHRNGQDLAPTEGVRVRC
jgi:iron complex transport system substrate-binding protein